MQVRRRLAGLGSWSTAEDALLLVPRLVLAAWPQYVIAGFIAGVLGTAATFLVHPRYRANASFVPVTSGTTRLPASLGGIAAQFGISPTVGGGISPTVFDDLVRTAYIRTQVASASYALPACLDPVEPTGTLLEVKSLAGWERLKAMDAAVRRLGSETTVKYDPVAQLVSLTVETCSPALSAAIAEQYLNAVQLFSTETLRSQAKAARESAERRIEQLAANLRGAEDALTQFYVKNRTFAQSPVLQQEETRLRRQVSMLETTYLNVRAEYERARLDEARATPAVTVIEPPVPPVRKSWPTRWLVGLIAASIACAALLTRHVTQLRTRPQEG
jgi:hypothetical protein